MRFLLAWVVLVALACASMLLSFTGAWMQQAAGQAAPEPPLADRLIWAGVLVSGFVVFDFIRRASTAEDLTVRRAEFAWYATMSALFMVAFAGIAGVLIGSASAGVDGLRVLGPVSIYVIVGAGVLSLLHVLRVEYWIWRHRPR